MTEVEHECIALRTFRHGATKYVKGDECYFTQSEINRLMKFKPPVINQVEPAKASTVVEATVEKTSEQVEKPEPELTIQSEPVTKPQLSPEFSPELTGDKPDTEDATEIEDVERLSINEATEAELVTLFGTVNGIGAGTAKKVVENRPYAAVEDVPEQAGLANAVKGRWPQIADKLDL